MEIVLVFLAVWIVSGLLAEAIGVLYVKVTRLRDVLWCVLLGPFSLTMCVVVLVIKTCECLDKIVIRNR